MLSKMNKKRKSAEDDEVETRKDVFRDDYVLRFCTIFIKIYYFIRFIFSDMI